MWSCKKGCKSWSMELCTACTAGVLGVGKHLVNAFMAPTGDVYSEGKNIGTLKSFEGFSCLADGKPLNPGDTPPCPKCGQPIFWAEPTPKQKPKAKGLKKHALVVPTTQDTKAAQYISKYMESHGYPPTIREIMVACEYPSSSSAFRGRERLVAAGIIKVVKGAARGIKGSGLYPSQAMSTPYMPMFSFKTFMLTWQNAVDKGLVAPGEHEGGIFLIAPEAAMNKIRWFKSTKEAEHFKKSMLE